jgi:hypothetical protein
MTTADAATSTQITRFIDGSLIRLSVTPNRAGAAGKGDRLIYDAPMLSRPLIALLALLATSGVAAQKPVEKVDVVAVVGCLRQAGPDTWTLVNATDPVVSTTNAPSPKELASMPRSGKQEFQLIGVTPFNLPAHRDQTVAVKGLHIKATPRGRINVTSVTPVAPTCEAAKAP